MRELRRNEPRGTQRERIPPRWSVSRTRLSAERTVAAVRLASAGSNGERGCRAGPSDDGAARSTRALVPLAPLLRLPDVSRCARRPRGITPPARETRVTERFSLDRVSRGKCQERREIVGSLVFVLPIRCEPTFRASSPLSKKKCKLKVGVSGGRSGWEVEAFVVVAGASNSEVSWVEEI